MSEVDGLIETWDVYDLDDTGLLVQLGNAEAFAAQGLEKAATLAAVIRMELRERGVSTHLMHHIDAPAEAAGSVQAVALPSAPPCAQPPIPVVDAPEPPVPRRRGLWDSDSSSSDSNDERRRPPPPLMRRNKYGCVSFASKRPQRKVLKAPSDHKSGPARAKKQAIAATPTTSTTRKPSVPRAAVTPPPLRASTAGNGVAQQPGKVPSGRRSAIPRLASLVTASLEPVTELDAGEGRRNRASGIEPIDDARRDRANAGDETRSAGPVSSPPAQINMGAPQPPASDETQLACINEGSLRHRADPDVGTVVPARCPTRETSDEMVENTQPPGPPTSNSLATEIHEDVHSENDEVEEPKGPTEIHLVEAAAAPATSAPVSSSTPSPLCSPRSGRSTDNSAPDSRSTQNTQTADKPVGTSRNAGMSTSPLPELEDAQVSRGCGDLVTPEPMTRLESYDEDITQSYDEDTQRNVEEQPSVCFEEKRWAPNDFARRFPRPKDLLLDPLLMVPVAQREVPRLSRALVELIEAWEAERREQFERDDEAPPPLARWGKVQQTRDEVLEVLQEAMAVTDDWCECDSPFWDVWWLWRKPRPHDAVWFISQRVNHIPKTGALTHKDQLKTALQRYSSGRGAAAALFNIMPLTFNLPRDYVPFLHALGATKPGALWIMKTIGMSRGRGIKLVSSIDDVTYSVPVVVQQYVDRPLLLAGRKFDLRLYVCVTQFNPLEAFLSSIGFARMAPSPYSLDAGKYTDLTVHLTNTAVSEAVASGGGNKISLEQLQQANEVHPWPTTWARVRSTVLRTLVGVEDKIPRTTGAFELFGFDVLLDTDLKPWVLEVNASPSMEMYGALDRELKPRLIGDVLELAGSPAIDRHKVKDAFAAIDRRGTYCGKLDWGSAVSGMFYGRMPRSYGDPPPQDSSFSMIAPSPEYEKTARAKKAAV
jgi:hypothetical protein